MAADATQLEAARQLAFAQSQDLAQRQEAVTLLHTFFGTLGRGLLTVAAIGAVLGLIIVLLYRPRVRRGGFWQPFFGLFGGAPTLYLHRRPASVLGWFWSRRRRHR